MNYFKNIINFKELNFNFPKNVIIGTLNYEIEVELLNKKTSSVKVEKQKLIFRISKNLSNLQVKKHFNFLYNKVILDLEKDNLFDFPKSILINDVDYLIKVNFIDKLNSSVNLRENIISFRLSNKLSHDQINQHFNELLKNIVKKISKKSIKKVLNLVEVIERGFFIFNSEKYNFEYYKFKRLVFKNNIFYIPYDVNLKILEKYIIKVLINKYQFQLEKYVHEINNQTFNYSIGKFTLKLVNSKWGHCSSVNDILLNLKLLNANIEVLNYVIIHELAHIKVKNHSSLFWHDVEKFCPNYKELRNNLKNNPPTLYK